MGNEAAWFRRVRPGVAGVLTVLLAGGCALSFKAPTVRVAEVRVTSMTLTGGSVRVAVDVHNPNGYTLESHDLDYTVFFAGSGEGDERWAPLARGRMDRLVRVEGGATERVEVDVPFDVRSAGAALGRLLRQGELEYRFAGALQAGTPLGVRRIPFDQRGIIRP